MANATDQQMQVYCDTEIRPWWERMRGVYLFAKSAKLLIDDEYARSQSASAWADARTDGPPHLLQSGNGANPDDLQNFNAAITALITIIEGTDNASDAANAAMIRSCWSVGQRACVQPPPVFTQ